MIEAHHVWVGVSDGSVVALIVMWAEVGYWYIDNIAVDPAWQGTGAGSTLLGEAERQAQSAQLDEIRLYTNEAMISNQGFYPRRGFTETHRAVDHGYRRIFYARHLGPG